MGSASSTIQCKQCGIEIEVSEALTGQIEAQVLAAEHKRHQAEMQMVLAEAAETAKRERESALEMTRKHLAGEKERLENEKKAELDIARRKLESEAMSAQKKAAAQQEMLVRQLREDAEHEKESKKQLEASNAKFREQIAELMQAIRDEKKGRENAEIEAQKKLSEEEGKIREEATRLADERQRLNLASKEKTITDLQKALDDAQRKAAQGSQQMQGEIMELDLEKSLADAFRDDQIAPVAKGVNGADISQTVCTPRGSACGVILWEIKRTKNWTDGWIPKLKADLRASKANIPVIITEAMPKQIDGDMGQLEGVWVCKPGLALVLGMLLRKTLLDVGAQVAKTRNQGGKAEALYGYITGHEFHQQIESMVETYQEMTLQVQKERVAYEKLWAQREKQAQKLFMGTANIVGGMQGNIGQAAMPRIKGLELDSGIEESAEEDIMAGMISELAADIPPTPRALHTPSPAKKSDPTDDENVVQQLSVL
ncbi:MAG TPA: DUF2130 domain-containing protein [Candidatus Saccharimonadales bacterium]